MYIFFDTHAHTHKHAPVETTSFVLGLLKKCNQGFMLGSTVVWKKSACKMTVKASTPQTHVTVTLKSQFECIEQLRTTGMQNIRETARECACTHQFAWPRHPSRKSMCLKCCSKEPGRKTQGPQQTAALTQQVDTTKRLQDRKATARRHMSEVTLNRDHGLIQMVHTSVHTHMTHTKIA